MTGAFIRPATPADLPAMLGYIRELAAWEGRPEAATATVPRLHALLFGPRPHAEAYILTDPASGDPVGYAWIITLTSTFTADTRLYLEDLYISSAARGKGLGRRFMAWLSRLAQSRGCAGVDWSVVEGNTRAIAFYERLGAVRQSGAHRYRLAGDALDELAAENPSE
ncbi:MAG: GNAT family N-acetyltransferase [Phycisphaerae bacterium]|nr:GNAT family N-acetyltransferase [Phycisphaerae bacterium]